MQKTIEKANKVMQAEPKKVPFKTIAYQQASMENRELSATNKNNDHTVKDYLDAPYGRTSNPIEALT